ncbi:MAG: hypothetical protein ACXQT4_00360 [Methanotrichaceae archaeon]
MMAEEKQKIVKAEDILPKGGDFSLPLLTDLVNTEIKIKDIRFAEGQYGEYAVVTLENGEQYRTSSTVLLDQLKKFKQYTDQGMIIVATVRKQKRYYTFE